MKGNKGIKLLLLWLAIVVILTGCNSNNADSTKVSSKNDTDITDNSANIDKERTDVTDDSADVSEITDNNSEPSVEDRVKLLISRMTLEEKIGQMLQGERSKVTAGDMRELNLGSVLSGGGSFPGRNTPEDWRSMIMNYQEGAMKTSNKIPMLYGIDAVHGVALLRDAVVFPHNIGLGAANDPELMYEMGAAVAEEMKLINVLWNFSPCVAVSTDPRWGRTYECYSSDPEIVSALAEAYIKGQADHGVVSTAKHYVADGGAEYGTGEGANLIDRGDVSISEEELRATHLLPYKRLVDSGVRIIMASFTSYNGVKVHENRYLLTEVLKEELGFDGFIVSDWEATKGLSGGSYEENVVIAVNAGIDMLMEPNQYEDAYNALIEAAQSGELAMERVDDAVRRILTVKMETGLFDDPFLENITREVSEPGSDGYRELARKLAEKSLVLLKNEKSILPLKKGQKIYALGPALDNIGIQCGGWGLTWQGLMDQNGVKVTEGTTILEGLEQYGAEYGFEIITEESRAQEADMVLLVIGEQPYAEWMGDTADLSITGKKAHPGNTDAIMTAKSLGKPVVTLIVAGRNVLINDYMDDWDGIVMCYLPGSEGDAVAAVLSGEADFTGRLPMPYYGSVEDIGKSDAGLLYEAGYGLSYE